MHIHACIPRIDLRLASRAVIERTKRRGVEAVRFRQALAWANVMAQSSSGVG